MKVPAKKQRWQAGTATHRCPLLLGRPVDGCGPGARTGRQGVVIRTGREVQVGPR